MLALGVGRLPVRYNAESCPARKLQPHFICFCQHDACMHPACVPQSNGLCPLTRLSCRPALTASCLLDQRRPPDWQLRHVPVKALRYQPEALARPNGPNGLNALQSHLHIPVRA
jgi:hypothetical protein